MSVMIFFWYLHLQGLHHSASSPAINVSSFCSTSHQQLMVSVFWILVMAVGMWTYLIDSTDSSPICVSDIFTLGHVCPSPLFLPLNSVQITLDLLPLDINFWVSLYSHKITCLNFGWDCIEPVNQGGNNWHLDSIESSCPWNQFIDWLISFIRVL